MRSLVLGLGYRAANTRPPRNEWRKHGIEFDFADDFQQAVRKLGEREYVCVAVCSDYLPTMTSTPCAESGPSPLSCCPRSIMPPSGMSASSGVPRSTSRPARHRLEADMSGKDNMRYCLDLSDQERQPLTIITVKDLTFAGIPHRGGARPAH